MCVCVCVCLCVCVCVCVCAHAHSYHWCSVLSAVFRLGDYTRDDLTSDLHTLSKPIHFSADDDMDPVLKVSSTCTCTVTDQLVVLQTKFIVWSFCAGICEWTEWKAVSSASCLRSCNSEEGGGESEAKEGGRGERKREDGEGERTCSHSRRHGKHAVSEPVRYVLLQWMSFVATCTCTCTCIYMYVCVIQATMQLHVVLVWTKTQFTFFSTCLFLCAELSGSLCWLLLLSLPNSMVSPPARLTVASYCLVVELNPSLTHTSQYTALGQARLSSLTATGQVKLTVTRCSLVDSQLRCNYVCTCEWVSECECVCVCVCVWVWIANANQCRWWCHRLKSMCQQCPLIGWPTLAQGRCHT